MKCSLEVQFSAAHLYHQTAWTDQQNLETFGKCFSKWGHGHDYKLVVDYDLTLLKDQNHKIKVLENIALYFDHKHLNYDLLDFKDLIPTTENIALICFKKIKELDPEFAQALTCIKIYERPDLWAQLDF